MGKTQGGKGGGKGGGKQGEWTERVDPAEVRFTHSKIRPVRARLHRIASEECSLRSA
jgi:hypothetical protein